jgi:hypothetical protein
VEKEASDAPSNSVEKQQCENVKVLYDQLCASYHAIDDFRTKLLGFLPLATAAGAATLFLKDLNLTVRLWPETIDSKAMLITPIGIFGFAVTIGLYVFEIHGIAKCHALIETGRQLEEKLGGAGQFATRPDRLYEFLNEPLAGAIIYGAVLAAWVLIASLLLSGLILAALIAAIVFVVSFRLSARHELHLKEELSLQQTPSLPLIVVPRPNRNTPAPGA